MTNTTIRYNTYPYNIISASDVDFQIDSSVIGNNSMCSIPLLDSNVHIASGVLEMYGGSFIAHDLNISDTNQLFC